MRTQTTSSQVSHDRNSSSQGRSFGSPKVRVGCQGNFIWEGTATGNVTAAVSLQWECRDRTGLVDQLYAVDLALCTQICDDLLPKHLAENKWSQVHQSYPTMQAAWKWAYLAAEPELASFVPEAALSKRESTGTAKLLGAAALWWGLYGMGDCTCWNGNNLTYVPFSVFNWQPEIKVICGSKDREGVGGNQLCF